MDHSQHEQNLYEIFHAAGKYIYDPVSGSYVKSTPEPPVPPKPIFGWHPKRVLVPIRVRLVREEEPREICLCPSWSQAMATRFREKKEIEFANQMTAPAWHTFLSDYYNTDIARILDSIAICYDALVSILLRTTLRVRTIIVHRYGLLETFREIGARFALTGSGVQQRLGRAICSLHAREMRQRFRSAIAGEWRIEQSDTSRYHPCLSFGSAAVKSAKKLSE